MLKNLGGFSPGSGAVRLTALNIRRSGSPVTLKSFAILNVIDIITAIHHLSCKSLTLDVLLVQVIKQVAAEVVPFLTELFNRSLSRAFFQTFLISRM
jgi:hypothetical protein